MSNRSSAEIVDREYLEMRAKVLELGASLDRIARARGEGDCRMDKISTGLNILLDGKSDKAKRVQMLFSADYEETWRKDFGI